MERAVAIAYNYETGQHLHTPFEGEGAGIAAMNWVRADSFLWKDFPESKGWTHFYHCNDEAREAKGKAITDAMFPATTSAAGQTGGG